MALDQRRDPLAQFRDKVGLKPGMVAQPALVSGAWMGCREEVGQELLPALDRGTEGVTLLLPQIIALCVATDQQGQGQVG